MSDRVDLAYGVYTEAFGKFDYFMAGLACALVGYIGADTDLSVRLEWSAALMETVAAGLFLFSAVFALLKIETTIEAYKSGYQQLWLHEEAVKYSQAAASGVVIEHSEGRPMHPQEAALRSQWLRERSQEWKESAGSQGDRGVWHRRLRNVFLVLGFATLILARFAP